MLYNIYIRRKRGLRDTWQKFLASIRTRSGGATQCFSSFCHSQSVACIWWWFPPGVWELRAALRHTSPPLMELWSCVCTAGKCQTAGRPWRRTGYTNTGGHKAESFWPVCPCTPHSRCLHLRPCIHHCFHRVSRHQMSNCSDCQHQVRWGVQVQDRTVWCETDFFSLNPEGK